MRWASTAMSDPVVPNPAASLNRPRARWLEASIRATAEAAEAISALFEQAGQGGVVIEPEIVPGRDADEGTADPDGFTLLKTYLADDPGIDARREILESRISLLRAFDLAPMGELEWRWLDEDDWANAWKSHYAIQRLGRSWVIKPEWQEFTPEPGDIVLELDPGMAFGTGLHPTTQTVLVCLEELVGNGSLAGLDILDLGTGSGILAVGAARLGATSILALDVDRIAVTAAAHNARLNGVSEAITVEHGTIGEPLPGLDPVPGLQPIEAYDGVMANIVARVIGERASAIAQAIRHGGWLITSGIIVDRENEATDALVASGLDLVARHLRGDWVTQVWRRP